ncbi:MAG: NAD(P)/FAD-dependent oxidoreductase [Sandaracinaceae bacterium]|nr:NAD(P)/FAD-dependent oxidoreductase [Sandaracinaceae bacterium]
MPPTHVDVLIVGAGLSGVGTAAQLTMRCPGKSFLVLERREAIGGTWDFFRYPGIRCDSDMHTLGYSFRPWPSDTIITEAESIRSYIEDTAREYGVLERVRFRHRVVRASWSSREARWTVDAVVEPTNEKVTFTAGFVVGCAGYYNYDRAHTPSFPGTERFAGDIVHAQFWDEAYDYRGKRVVVIGSGATAVTLVPAMTKQAAHVTMLQRSPTYMVSLPKHDATVTALKRVLPERHVGAITRLRNTALQLGLYKVSQRYPAAVRKLLLRGVERQLGPDVSMRHFTPDYDPWDERLCVVPDGDLFKELNAGRASIVTDQVETFTESGVRLRSGETLPADLVVLATGLEVQLLGGVAVTVDGVSVDPNQRLTYRAAMFADIPNLAMIFGYVNVSWTRKADLVAEFVCRLLNHMDRHGYQQVTPGHSEGFATDEPFVALKSGYLKRGASGMPLQGSAAPWRNSQNVFVDTVLLRYGRLQDRYLRFTRRPRESKVSQPARTVPRVLLN